MKLAHLILVMLMCAWQRRKPGRVLLTFDPAGYNLNVREGL